MSEALFLETLEEAALAMTEIPLWGSPPLFPFEKLSQALATALEVDSLDISVHKTEWRSQEKMLQGMGKSPFVQPFSLSPLPGTFFWVMPSATQETLLQLLLSAKTNPLTDSTLEHGFTTYVFLHVLRTINQLNPYGNLAAHLEEETPLPEEGALAIDVAIAFEETTLWGRVLVPQDAQASFKSHFTMEKPPLLSDPRFAALPLSLRLQVGNTTLSAEQWNRVSVGDFVLLDRCTYDIKEGKGTALLALAHTPLFDVRIKEGQVKLLEYALTQEVLSMTEDDTPFEEENEESSSWNTQTGEEDILSLEKIPIHLTVEVSRIQMPLEKVTKLKPGNVLNLGIGVQPDVYLVVSGKRIAKGELVNLGEALGVKVLKMGE